MPETLIHKETPYAHQLRCLDLHGKMRWFALFADMGTGKTWIVLINAAELWSAGKLDSLLVFAPNGVQTNWTRIQIPRHMPDAVRYRAAAWSLPHTKAEELAINYVCEPSSTGTLRILTMNWEALSTKDGLKTALTFARSSKALMIAADESDNIKNPKAIRTKALMKVRQFAEFVRIMTGTASDGTPYSLFSQFALMDPAILGTTSYTAFKSEYAEMLPPGSPLVNAIVAKHRLRFIPQIERRGADGRPIYKNLDKLKRLIAPYTFRVMKSECLDLPPKIYKSVIFSMTKQQQAIYLKAEKEQRLVYEKNETPFNKLAIATKLSQITSGYYLHPDASEPVRIEGENPKLAHLIDRVRVMIEEGAKAIIWARYTIEIDDILAALKVAGFSHAVRYDGQVKKKERIEAVDEFELGKANVFVGNQQAGGTGLTLIAASYVNYFSNNYSLRDRLQSEDRPHRIGQKKTVTYLDYAAKGTIDETIITCYQGKKEISDIILNNNFELFRR